MGSTGLDAVSKREYSHFLTFGAARSGRQGMVMKAVRVAALLLLAGWVFPAIAQTHVYSVYVDRDNDPATGCSIVTAAGTVAGIEAVLSADVSVDPPQVTGQNMAQCQSGTLGAAVPVPGSYPYPVGFDQDAGAYDVVELGAHLQAFGLLPSRPTWRLIFGSDGALLGGADLTDAVSVSGIGHRGDPPALVPSVSLAGLALLSLALALVAFRVGRRRPQLFSVLLVASALGLSGVAWAAYHALDGAIGDWAGAPQATDPAGDATQNEAPIDIRQAFAAREGVRVFFRIDVSETRLSELVPPLIDSAFTIPENSPAGTAIGPVRPAAVGLSSILSFTPGSQTPAAALVFDPASTMLSVANSTLLDFETHPQFQYGFTATVAGAPGFALPVTATVDVVDVNEVPTLAPQAFSVLENAATGTVLGAVAASDPDAGANGQLAYAITTAQGVFALDANSGTLSLADAALLDISASPYSLAISVSDGGSPALVASATLTISVVDVNDAPGFTGGGNLTVGEDSGAYDQPWASALSDGDGGGQTLSFHVIANDNPALFSVVPQVTVSGGDGRLAFTPLADASGVANLTVVLRDDGGTANGGVDESAPVSFQIAVAAVNDAPVLTVPAAQSSDGSSPLVFSTANGNAISAVDVDAGTGVISMQFDSDGGVLTLANPGGALSITGNGSTSVLASGTLVELNAALAGASGALTYQPTPGATVARTLTVGIDDQGHSGAGGAQSDSATVAIDAAPGVDATPAAGLVAVDAAFTLSFSEPVDVAAGALALSCNGGANLVTGGDSGSGVTSLAPTLAGPLPEGHTCVLSLPAAAVSDSDGVDPPDAPVADFSRSYSVDAAPAVVATTPASGTTVANDVVLSITFSEEVNVAAGALTLTCGGTNLITGGDSGSGVTTLSPTFAAPLPAGACVLSVLAASVDDADLADPPAHPVADHLVHFTVDAAPALTGTVPAEGAIAGAGTVASFTFDENVADLGGAISLACGGAPVAGSVTGSGTATLTFTPSSPLSEGASCTATALASAIGDSDAADPPDHPAADTVRNFVVDSAPTLLSITPADGAVGVGLGSNLVVTFSEPVNFPASAFALECPGAVPVAVTVSGSGTATATVDPVPAMLPINTLCEFRVDAAQITDVDAADPPDAGTGLGVVHFTTVDDQPPAVTATAPATGDVVARDAALSISFSEPVDVVPGAVTLDCGSGNLITGGGSGSGVTSLSPTRAGALPEGASCTLTVQASGVTDSDAIDPPDAMPADHVVSFTVDAAPSVLSSVPANGAVNVSSGSGVTLIFSEPVNVSVSSFSFLCGGSAVPFILSGNGSDTVGLTPAGSLPGGASCTITALAAGVADVDAIDPPDQMAVDHAFSFDTDAAPAVISTSPIGGAVIGNLPSLVVNFSESVSLDAGAFSLDCAGPVAVTASPALPASGVTSITFAPAAALPEGANCTATVLATAVHDDDSADPPDGLSADHVWSFSVDAAPQVDTVVPANGASAVNPGSSITVSFSEPVNFDTSSGAGNASFGLECPNGTPVPLQVLTASPAASVTLDPPDATVAGEGCTLTVRAAGIQDADAFDPPNAMAADFTAAFTYAALANDDSVAVTPHLTVSTAGGAINLAANDLLGSGQVTSFGSGSCSGTPAGSQLDAGSSGRLTIQPSGQFSYEPPANAVNVSHGFCYTVTGGDTASITFNIQNAARVWFIDRDAPAGGIGTQARPFTALSAAGGHSANDTLFVARGSAATAAGLVLKNGVRLIGEGAVGTLAALSGVTPVAGSSFPALGGVGSEPNLTCAGTCITLGSGNTLRGVRIGDSGAGGTDISGTGFGTLTVSGVLLDGSGRALDLSNGTLSGSFADINVTSGNQEGLRLDGVGGTWNVVGAVDIGNVSGTGLNLINAPAGASATFTGGLNVAKTGAGSAVNLSGNHASAVIHLGSVSLTAGASGSSGTGLAISNSPVTLGGGSIAAVDGPAINATGATFGGGGGSMLASASSSNSASQGIRLDGASGTLTILGGAITGAGTTAFDVVGGGGSISYSGTINNSGNRAVSVRNRTGTAQVSFLGSITDTGRGVLVDANAAGSLVRFSGGMALNTGTFPAFVATGGGTVVVCDRNPCGSGTAVTNVLSTTTATALQVLNTTIGSNDLVFRSISSNGASSGIVLDSTGSAGGLVVSGNGGSCTSVATCTGGAIRNSSQHGVRLNATTEPAFTRLAIQTSAGSGIFGTRVSGFTFSNGFISDSGGDLVPDRANIAFNTQSTGSENNLEGVVSITDSLLTYGYYHGIDIVNYAGTLSAVTLRGNTLTSSINGGSGSPCAGAGTPTTCSRGSGVRLIAFGSGSTVANVTRGTIENNTISNFPAGAGIQVQGGNANTAGPSSVLGSVGSATDLISITGNLVRGASAANRIGTFAILTNVNGRGQGNFSVSGNGTAADPLGNTSGTTVSAGGFGQVNVSQRIDNNRIVSNNQFASQGIGGGTGRTAAASETPALALSVTGNAVSQTDGNGILLVAREATGVLRAKLQANTVAAPLSGNRNGIRIDSGNASSANESVCLNLSGNTSAGVNLSPQGIGLRKQGSTVGVNNFALHGFSTTPATGTQTAAYATAQNPGSSSGTLIINGDNFNTPTCTLP